MTAGPEVRGLPSTNCSVQVAHCYGQAVIHRRAMQLQIEPQLVMQEAMRAAMVRVQSARLAKPSAAAAVQQLPRLT
jgi:hypothetical protein